MKTIKFAITVLFSFIVLVAANAQNGLNASQEMYVQNTTADSSLCDHLVGYKTNKSGDTLKMILAYNTYNLGCAWDNLDETQKAELPLSIYKRDLQGLSFKDKLFLVDRLLLAVNHGSAKSICKDLISEAISPREYMELALRFDFVNDQRNLRLCVHKMEGSKAGIIGMLDPKTLIANAPTVFLVHEDDKSHIIEYFMETYGDEATKAEWSSVLKGNSKHLSSTTRIELSYFLGYDYNRLSTTEDNLKVVLSDDERKAKAMLGLD